MTFTPTPALIQNPMNTYYSIGYSSLQIPIFTYELGKENSPRVLILGGIHGDEIEGIILANALLAKAQSQMPADLRLAIIPQANPDGMLLKTRGNGKGVDLNRNLPTKDWSPIAATARYFPGPAAGSEPENQALMSYLEKFKPKLIISLHSWHPVLNVNGDCLPEAEIISQHTGYKVDAEIGYPTPGCLGTYTGLERGIGTLTYEIERGQAPDKIAEFHTPGIWAALRKSAERF